MHCILRVVAHETVISGYEKIPQDISVSCCLKMEKLIFSNDRKECLSYRLETQEGAKVLLTHDNTIIFSRDIPPPFAIFPVRFRHPTPGVVGKSRVRPISRP